MHENRSVDIKRVEKQVLDKDSITKIYGGQSKFYDAIFKKVFYQRIRHAIYSMDIRPGEKILDVGVGTGLSLPFYPKNCIVTGIDISSHMLSQAEKKIERLGLNNIRLIEMDAMHIKFPDNSFDKVFTSHVVSVVPDPYRMINEVRRVCKKGGRIVIVNHFRSRNKMVARVEKMITPLSMKLGWRSDLDLDVFINTSGLKIEKKYKLKKLDFWHVIFAINEK